MALFVFSLLFMLAAGFSPVSALSDASPGSSEPDGSHPPAGDGPWPMTAFAMPDNAKAPEISLEGELSLGGTPFAGIRVLTDDFALADNPDFQLQTLPEVVLSVVSEDRFLVPAQRGPLRLGHPYWEWIAAPGRVWQDDSRPGWSLAVLPFSLKEGNQNCLHNGVLFFEIDPQGTAGGARWQVASETCQYLKFDGWGDAAVSFRQGDVDNAKALRADFQKELADRMPVKPLSRLQQEFPAIDLAALAPPNPADTTVYGLVLDGMHYRSDCPTRQGPHPYCEEVAVPSYSTAKSLFAGLVFLAMVNRWPELEAMTVTDLVPECDLPDGRWQDVGLRELVNMSTGNFESASFEGDESSPVMQQFFIASDNARKLNFSCTAWPRSAEPGTTPAYHSTDHYILGVALQRFVQARLGPQSDIHRDVLVGEILAPMRPGALMTFTQRTYDDDQQPFVAYGLFFTADDVARLGLYLQDDEALGKLISAGDLAGIRFRDRSGMAEWQLSRGEGYFAGFWGFDLAPHAGCDLPTWVPFMSGYGGIRLALPANGAVYYFFSDGGHASWMDALIELNRFDPLCKEPDQ